jgi:hypothetical protein
MNRIQKLEEALRRLLRHDPWLPTIAEENDREFAKKVLEEKEGE